MPQDPFPSPPGDEQEPDGFPLHADEEPGPDEEGMAQGLYVCLPAGQLTLAGFCQGGASDTMAPGALLATVVEAVAGEDGAGLAGCSDDQLLGIISAARRLESRAAWTLMAATGEFARRAGTGLEGEFAADELASELHMSQQSAAGQMDFAAEVPKRLPKTFAALAAGQIHPVHLRIIEDETRIPDRRRCGQSRHRPRRLRPGQDVRRTPLRRAQAGPEARPRRGPQAQGSRQTRSARPPVPGGVRERWHGRPRAAL